MDTSRYKSYIITVILQIKLEIGEEVFVLDNSDHERWQVRLT